MDSRLADDGESIRRRRECLNCRRRFTTYERLEDAPLWVIKRSGSREPFEAAKVARGIRAATKNRPVSAEQIGRLVQLVEESLKTSGKEVSFSQIGLAVLDRLRELDEVAYLRFASVYKNFANPSDFEREVGLLIKETRHVRSGTSGEHAREPGDSGSNDAQHHTQRYRQGGRDTQGQSGSKKYPQGETPESRTIRHGKPAGNDT
ncbi:MAG: transcriptional regulator NrdR [Actinobacteria bacterium]|nr:transcriptional regulator NrdR [Actinomycetota bacterium]MCL5446364.1 transcriptional regulator NrdR [Actinomycetota bacterium]